VKKQNLKRIITMILVSLSISTIIPIKALAAWKENNMGWWYTEGQDYAKGWECINEKWYYFDNNGYMKNGWINDNGNWYFANYDGEMQTGLIQVDGKTYKLSSSGGMMTGDITIEDKIYSFATTGELQGDNIPNVTKSFTINGVVTEDSKANDTNTTYKETVEIDLESNPTTGYQWQYENDKEGIIKEVSNIYKEKDVSEEITGSGGTDVWIFEGLKEGSSQVTFNYLRSWEKEVAETKTFIFTVDKERNITVEEIVG
jgi:inhibitor of cysteine peptidase